MCEDCLKDMNDLPATKTAEEVWPLDSIMTRFDPQTMNILNWCRTLSKNEYILSMDVNELVLVFTEAGGSNRWDIPT